MVSIAIDIMGGEGPSVTIPASLKFAKEFPDCQLHLFGTSDTSSKLENLPNNMTFHESQESVTDHDSVSVALKQRKTSSMRLGLNFVKSGHAEAFVSAGNTGVLMAMSRYVLKMLPGVDRPAISGVLPTKSPDFGVRMLDLGANVDAPAEVLLQFAVIGMLLARHVDGIKKPRIGLLNIGEENHKGNDTIKRAAQLIDEHPDLHYVGYIEPNHLFSQKADVVVCDGLLGNVALKSIEGASKLIKSYIKSVFTSNLFFRLLGFICWPALNSIAKQMSTSSRNGATLVGLRATVVKSHGSANAKGFAQAIKNAYYEVKRSVPEKVNQELSI